MKYAGRRSARVLLASALFLLIAQNAFCDDPLKKLGRGMANVITSPIEIPNQVQRAANLDGAWAGFTIGPVKGVFMTAVRAVVGVYEIATFFVPVPRNYGPILKDPEFFFEESTS